MTDLITRIQADYARVVEGRDAIDQVFTDMALFLAEYKEAIGDATPEEVALAIEDFRQHRMIAKVVKEGEEK